MIVCDQAWIASHKEDDGWRRGAGRGVKRVFEWGVEEYIG